MGPEKTALSRWSLWPLPHLWGSFPNPLPCWVLRLHILVSLVLVASSCWPLSLQPLPSHTAGTTRASPQVPGALPDPNSSPNFAGSAAPQCALIAFLHGASLPLTGLTQRTQPICLHSPHPLKNQTGHTQTFSKDKRKPLPSSTHLSHVTSHTRNDGISALVHLEQAVPDANPPVS